MKRAKYYAVFLLMLMLSFQYLGTISNYSTVKSAANKVNIEVQADSNPNYNWIWDEFYRAPRNIIGEDVVFWGGDLGPYHNYTEMETKLFTLEANFPD